MGWSHIPLRGPALCGFSPRAHGVEGSEDMDPLRYMDERAELSRKQKTGRHAGRKPRFGHHGTSATA